MCFCRELLETGRGCSRPPALRCRFVAMEASPGGSEPGSVSLLLSWERKLRASPFLLLPWLRLGGQQPDGLCSPPAGLVTFTLPGQVRHQDSYHHSWRCKCILFELL